jgi:hypothetical protein
MENQIPENEPEITPSSSVARDIPNWAAPIPRLDASNLPPGSINLNLEGKRLTSPMQGFGPLWQKTYQIRLSGVDVTPQEVVKTWKENFARFQPDEIHFHPPTAGVRPGELMPIDFNLPIGPGLPEIFPLAGGVSIVYADEVSFTVMTPEGFPISGWNTFSAYEEDGATVAQVQSLIRSTDPVYEFGIRFMGGKAKQEKDWIHVLTRLASHYGVKGHVQVTNICLDPSIQWGAFKNVWQNGAIRTFFYKLATPIRWLKRLFRRGIS